MPYFSIVTPAYNREREIRRAIRSCLDQSYADFEIVVTDDGSTDGTADVVKQFARADPRVRLLRHAHNRGVCPARNTAAAAAHGEWLILLDSDQSLRPGALAVMRRLTASAAPDVGNVAARVAWDTGIVTPQPALAGRPLRYEEFVAWVNTLDETEWFNCIRRQVWTDGVRWPESRAYEASFHLGLAARWRFEIHPDVCSVYYTDAANRICRPKSPALAKRNLVLNPLDHAVDAEAILHRHGQVLAKHGPRQFYVTCYRASLNRFLSGYRLAGLRYWLKCVRQRPFSPHLWLLPLLGLAGPGVLANAYCWAKYSIPAYLRSLHK